MYLEYILSCDIIGSMEQRTNAKSEAIKLRRMGLSYREIRNVIKVSKSSLSLWLKTVPLKAEFRERLYTKQIQFLSLGAQSQKERRAREVEQIIKDAENEVALPMSKETYRLMGAALYWAEGSKGSMFEFTNSDPHLILFMTRWVEAMFKIPAKHIKARLNIYPQQNENKIKKFWSDMTGIPLENFGKSYVKPISKGFKKNNLYYGTMRLEVPRSVNIKHRTFGWVHAALKNVEPHVATTQRKWGSLTKINRPTPINLK